MEQQAISNNPPIHGEIEPDHSGYETLASLNDDGEYELSVLVGGVHCGGCIQKIESSLARETGVKNVRLNFSTRRLALTWTGGAAQANNLVHAVEKLGYSVQPYDPDTEKSETKKRGTFFIALSWCGGICDGECDVAVCRGLGSGCRDDGFGYA